MEISAPVTDYIKRSIMTSKGDIIKYDGTKPVRLPIGSLGHVLRVDPFSGILSYINSAKHWYEYKGNNENNSDVTVLITDTTIINITLYDVITNDQFYIGISIGIVKGATAGMTKVRIEKTVGSASIQCFNNANDIRNDFYHPATELMYKNINGLFRILSPGSLSMGVIASSFGSDSTVPAGLCEVYFTHLKTS